MHILTRLAGAAVAAAMLLAIGPVLAQDRLTIGTEGAYPPFNSLTSDGKLVGFDIDIAQALCVRMKTECSFVAQDWDGLIPALQAGKFDVIMASLTITEERKKQVLFTHKYYATPLAIVALKTAGLASTAAPALAGKALGVQAATWQAAYADDTYGTAGAEVKRYPAQDDAMADLLVGRLDAVLADKILLVDWMKSQGADCCTIVGDVAGTDAEAGIAVRKEDTALRDRLEAALDAILADGTYARIQAKYFDFDIYGK